MESKHVVSAVQYVIVNHTGNQRVLPTLTARTAVNHMACNKCSVTVNVELNSSATAPLLRLSANKLLVLVDGLRTRCRSRRAAESVLPALLVCVGMVAACASVQGTRAPLSCSSDLSASHAATEVRSPTLASCRSSLSHEHSASPRSTSRSRRCAQSGLQSAIRN